RRAGLSRAATAAPQRHAPRAARCVIAGSLPQFPAENQGKRPTRATTAQARVCVRTRKSPRQNRAHAWSGDGHKLAFRTSRTLGVIAPGHLPVYSAIPHPGRRAPMPESNAGILPDLLRRHESEILDEWLREIGSLGLRRSDVIREVDLRTEAKEFI